MIDNDRGFIAFENIARLLSADRNRIKKDLDARIGNDKNDREDLISCLDTFYYSLDAVILTAFDCDYKIAFKLYESASKKQISFTNYVNKTIKEEKESFQKLNLIVKDGENLLRSLYKFENIGKEGESYENIGYITTESIQILIGLIKEKYNFGKDFGLIRDHPTLLDILYSLNSVFLTEKPDEIDFAGDDVSYIAKTIYNIIKKKPFVDGNEIIAAFIAYYYLEQSCLIEDEGMKITSFEDIALSIGLIVNSKNGDAFDTLKKSNCILTLIPFL